MNAIEIEEEEETTEEPEAGPEHELPELLGPALTEALLGRGYTSLTAVQRAVLHPDSIGRDLRVTSQTGSGKTIAIGLVLRDLVILPSPRPSKAAKPRALIIVPTRELGRQVEEELGWLYAPLGVRVAAVTGGTSYRDEHRALALLPALVVGTPGRLLDHLEHGSLDPSEIAAVALDEADRMLDMGFTEALDAIFARVPEGRRTHLVSATFPPEVRHLADRVQKNPMHVEGTRLGVANADIEHVFYLVDPNERLYALVNLLLAHPDARTLVFAKTRAGVAELAEALGEQGIPVAALSGEMAQRERTRALAAFKRGALRVLVATDVAARGIDVSDISLVLHMEPPNDSDTYTHRSGRTGRAGRKGTSAVLVAPRELQRAQRIVQRARVQARIEPMPTAAQIRAMEDERLVALLAGDEAGPEIDERTRRIAESVVAKGSPERALARLLIETGLTRGPEPRELRVIQPPTRRDDRRDAPRGAPRTQMPPPGAGPSMEAPPSLDFVPFQVSFGARHGADARRLLAIVCRRGDIESRDIGAIRIGPASSLVEVRADRASAFEEASARPDPRDPRVRFRRYDASKDAAPRRPERGPQREGPPREAPGREGPPREGPPARSGPRREGPPSRSGPSRGGPRGGDRPPPRRR